MATSIKKGFIEVPFSGKLRTADHPTTIGPNDFQVLKNMRYDGAGIRSVGGQSKINTALMSSNMVVVYQYQKHKPHESHVLAENSSGYVYDITAVPPNTCVSANPYLHVPAGTDNYAMQATGRYATAPNDILVRCDGNHAWMYGGIKHTLAGFVDRPASAQYYDYTDRVSNTSSKPNDLATIHTITAGAYAYSTTYFGTILPASGFYVDMNTVNPATVTAGMKYYNGSAWASVASFVDGTSGLGADGWMTFGNTSGVSMPCEVNKQIMHWYQFGLTGLSASDFDGIPKISTVYASIPLQKAQDFWGGDTFPPALCYLETSAANYFVDITTKVAEDYYDGSETDDDNASTFARVGGNIGSTGFVYFGFQEPVQGLQIYLGGGYESDAAASAKNLDYYNGKTWVSLLSSMNDGTLDDTLTKTWGRSGWITWCASAINDEQPSIKLLGHSEIRSVADGSSLELSDGVPLYYYRWRPSATIGTSTPGVMSRLYHVRGIPANTTIGRYSFPVAHSGRIFLCDQTDGERNSARYSAAQTANVFRGPDTGTVYFGDESPVVAGASMYSRYGSTISNHLLMCKYGETWVLVGDKQEDYKTYQIDASIGCVAPLTMCSVGMPNTQGLPLSQSSAIWLSARGVEMYINGTVVEISHDIRDKFDPLHANYIGAALLRTATGFYDPSKYEYHLIIPNTSEWVYNLQYQKWFEIDRASGNRLVAGVSTTDASGTLYPYGLGQTGYLFRLENGSAFDDDAIASTVRLADIALHNKSMMVETKVDWASLVLKTKTGTTPSASATHYVDGVSTGTVIGSASPTQSGYGYVLRNVYGQTKVGTFHSPEFTFSSSGNNLGFEPVMWGAQYTAYEREK